MNNIESLVKIIHDGSADCINLKISKVGGLTKARAIRDLAISHGISMNILSKSESFPIVFKNLVKWINSHLESDERVILC